MREITNIFKQYHSNFLDMTIYINIEPYTLFFLAGGEEEGDLYILLSKSFFDNSHCKDILLSKYQISK